MQGRGVMIDLEAHCGRGESFVGYDQLMRIMEVDNVEVEEGILSASAPATTESSST
jgi:hypothetical protein